MYSLKSIHTVKETDSPNIQSEIQTSVDFRTSVNAKFPNSSDFKHFRLECVEIGTFCLDFRHMCLKDEHKGSDFRHPDLP